MRALSQNLRRFVEDTERTIAAARSERPLEDLRRMISGAPPVISLADQIQRDGFGLIAEIKECSPSQGAMQKENVLAAPEIYRSSAAVRGVSVLTNRSFFGAGMTLERLRQVKSEAGKPVLRKDFIVDAYQIYEARAFGADAVLLMANILDGPAMRPLFQLATDLGMDVLFETHTPEEIAEIPSGARLFGINCRNFDQSQGRYRLSRWVGQMTRLKLFGGRRKDLSIDFSRFKYGREIPAGAVKIAESGVTPETMAEVREAGFDAVLVGTALLLGPEPIGQVMGRFERAIEESRELLGRTSAAPPQN